MSLLLNRALPLIFLLLAPAAALADVVRIAATGSYEATELELERGERAEVVVWLASAGHALPGHKVTLLQVAKPEEPVAERLSDENGVVTFTDIPAGDYRVMLEPRSRDSGSFVYIGDVVLRAIESPGQSRKKRKR